MGVFGCGILLDVFDDVRARLHATLVRSGGHLEGRGGGWRRALCWWWCRVCRVHVCGFLFLFGVVYLDLDDESILHGHTSPRVGGDGVHDAKREDSVAPVLGDFYVSLRGRACTLSFKNK